MIVKLLLVFVGGGLGSVARFLVSLFVPKVRLSLCSIPLSTLCVNVLGCLAIGFLQPALPLSPQREQNYSWSEDFAEASQPFRPFRWNVSNI